MITRPRKFILRMLAFVAVVLAVAAILHRELIDAFVATPVLNGLILGVLLAGVIYTFRNVASLEREVEWLETFRRNKPGLAGLGQPRLLAPMASMITEKRDRFTLSATAMRSLLDGIQSRLDETREISRYTVGLLIFLGLLGTFWGLLQTIAAIADVIGGMSVGSGDLPTLFNQLKSGLEAPLRGMGTAFSASLFGLASSLVLGFLDLNAGQAQNRFYMDLEEWLAQATRLSSGAIGMEGEGSVPVYVQALLEQTAENLEGLQRTLARGEEGRMAANQAVIGLTERLGQLTDQMRASQQLLLRMAEGQQELRPVLSRLADAQSTGAIDDATRAHIRNLELYMARLLEEMIQGRNQVSGEIRSEIKLLARTIAALAENDQR
uniref:flagellar motor protein MotA n=1 Tax=Elioraea rosea TaxID=2492390 RepID=UPI00118510BA|nr:flagellar motor protein MotA [Elioraea rosea]